MNFINPNLEVIKIHNTLWEVKQIFTEDALSFFDSCFDSERRWNMDRRLERLSLPCPGEEDLFYPIGTQLAETVSNTIGQKVNYATSKLFLDLPKSHVPKHSDADQIYVMSQVYLGKNNDNFIPGTEFLEPVVHTVNYENNCGYFNLNTDKKSHQSVNVMNDYRLSVGFQFHLPK